MAFPLIPFIVGAATGAVVTYLLSDRISKRDADEDSVLSESPHAEVEEPSTAKGEASKVSSSSED